jgi:hypothetical protein
MNYAWHCRGESETHGPTKLVLCLAGHGLPLANNPSPSPFHRLKILRQEAAETANPISKAQTINLKPGSDPRHSQHDFSAPMWKASSIFQSSWPNLTQVMKISNHINSKLFIHYTYYMTIFRGFIPGRMRGWVEAGKQGGGPGLKPGGGRTWVQKGGFGLWRWRGGIKNAKDL